MEKRTLIKRAVFVSLAVAVVVVSLVYFGLSFGRPYMGVVLEYQRGAWVISKIDQNGAAAQAGAQIDDEVITIDGAPVESRLVFVEGYGRYSHGFSEIGIISSNGEVLNISVPDGLSWPIVVEHLGFLCLSLIFLITGSYVQVKRPGDIASTLLFWCGPLLLLALSSNAAAQSGYASALFISITAIVLGPWLLAHFFLVLPQERTGLRRSRLVYLIYIPAVLTLVLMPFLGYSDGQQIAAFRTFRFVIIACGFLAAAVIAVVNYFRTSSNRTRQQMKIILVAALLGILPIIIFSLLPEVFSYHPLLPQGFTMLFLVFIPLGIGYAMVTRRLMNIDIVIRKGLVNGTVTVVLAAVLTLALVLVIPSSHDSLMGSQRIAFYLVLGLLAAGLYGALRNVIGKFLDRHLTARRYGITRVIDNLNKNVSTLTDYQDISRIIVATIANAIDPKGVCLSVKSHYGSYEIAATQGLFSEIGYRQMLMDIDVQKNPLLEFPNSATILHPDLEFIIPLNGMQDQIGVLYVAGKDSGEKYTVDDMYLLQEIIDGATASLERTLLIRDVSLRDTFVSIASHELRSPLTAIMGYTDLLREQDPPEEIRKQWLRRIADCNQRLYDIVDQLLNVSRIQSGRTFLKLAPVNIKDFLEESVATHALVTDKHHFSLHIQDGTPDILAEHDKIRQALDNLLGNAIKYSPGGGEIAVRAVYEKQSDRVVISVADQGIGIGLEDRLSLFTTFHRIQRPETRGIPGTGLGLYIVKKWVEAMGGKVWLESELNKGSVFSIAIPAANGRVPYTAGGLPDEENSHRGR